MMIFLKYYIINILLFLATQLCTTTLLWPTVQQSSCLAVVAAPSRGELSVLYRTRSELHHGMTRPGEKTNGATKQTLTI